MCLVKKSFLLFLFFIFSFSSNAIIENDDNYINKAKKSYEKAQFFFYKKQYRNAIFLFKNTKCYFPNSNFASLSDFKIAVCYFKLEKWLKAAKLYDFFIKFYPRHRLIPLAYFNLANSCLNAIPKNFFLFPKSYTRDQKFVNDAAVAITEYLNFFPSHKKNKEALEIKLKLFEELANYEIGIAKFYVGKKKWFAAISRYNRIIVKYPATKVALQAILELSEISKNISINIKYK